MPISPTSMCPSTLPPVRPAGSFAFNTSDLYSTKLRDEPPSSPRAYIVYQDSCSKGGRSLCPGVFRPAFLHHTDLPGLECDQWLHHPPTHTPSSHTLVGVSLRWPERLSTRNAPPPTTTPFRMHRRLIRPCKHVYPVATPPRTCPSSSLRIHSPRHGPHYLQTQPFLCPSTMNSAITLHPP